jgi:ferredoxin-fold anticodon binding domain-containing protein
MKPNQTKTYTVSVSIEANCQFEVKASSIKEAKELADTSIEIVFDGECQSPEASILPILDDAVDEE